MSAIRVILPLTTTRGGVFEHAFEDGVGHHRLATTTTRTTINTNNKRLMDIEKSKYMGGDEKTTHSERIDFCSVEEEERGVVRKMKKENLEEEDDEEEEEEEVEDEDDANNNNPLSSGFSSL